MLRLSRAALLEMMCTGGKSLAAVVSVPVHGGESHGG
jgi:hypothetical protein